MNEFEPTDSWTLAQGSHAGRPMFLRFNVGLKPLVGSMEHQLRVGCAVPLKAPTPDGLPNKQEGEALGTVEDALVAALVDTKLAVHAAVISTNGMREFLFYAGDESAVRAAVDGVRKTTDYQVQLAVGPDPDWNVYLRLEPPAP